MPGGIHRDLEKVDLDDDWRSTSRIKPASKVQSLYDGPHAGGTNLHDHRGLERVNVDDDWRESSARVPRREEPG